MTSVTRPLKRLSPAAIYSQGKTRRIVIELRPPGDLIGFRLAGTRAVYFSDVAHLYREALRAEIARQAAEKRKAKAEKKKAK